MGSDRHRFWILYVLELEDDCYYVGITAYSRIDKRYEQHRAGKGARWTQLHKPRTVLWTKRLGYMSEREAVRIETAKTLELSKLYGMYKVRGGGLCNVNHRIHASMYNAHTPVVVACEGRPRSVPHDPIFHELRWLLSEE